jgi:hypothetical protein
MACQRKFFIKYVIRPAPKYISPALLYGTALHEGLATFYKTKSVAKAKAKALSEIKKVQSLYEHDADFRIALYRLPVLISHWAMAQGFPDLERYEILGVEEDFREELPGLPGFYFTGRMDLLVRDKTDGNVYVVDHKTSSSSKDITRDGLTYGDQATGYIWLAQKKLNVPIAGMIGDILYWHKNATSEANIDCFRPPVITRNGHEIRAFLLGLQQIFSEISQKVAAYRKGYDEDGLFPRNTFYCVSYGKLCEYATFCRTKMKPNAMPMGFEKDRRQHELGGQVEDQIGES